VRVVHGTSEREAALLSRVRAHPGERVPQLADGLGWSLQTTKRIVGTLKQAGRLRFEGAPKTGGYHLVEADR
jgi:DNA-binding IclR family transcriptional regulator